MSDRTDTRRCPRVSCDIPMEYQVQGDRPQEGRITKLGTAGALLTTQESPARGRAGPTLLPPSQQPARPDRLHGEAGG
jgi:hypothetical protein